MKFLGLVMPNNQNCQVIINQILGWLLGDILGHEIPNLHDTYRQ